MEGFHCSEKYKAEIFTFWKKKWTINLAVYHNIIGDHWSEQFFISDVVSFCQSNKIKKKTQTAIKTKLTVAHY